MRAARTARCRSAASCASPTAATGCCAAHAPPSCRASPQPARPARSPHRMGSSAAPVSRIRRRGRARSRRFVYAFPVDRLLQQLKYGGRLALADWAGAALASAVARIAWQRARRTSSQTGCVRAAAGAVAAARARIQPGARNRAPASARAVGLPLDGAACARRRRDAAGGARRGRSVRATSAARLPCTGTFAARGSRWSTT